MSTYFSLDGRRAVITGAASGIGAAIAQTYASAGAQLVLADKDGERLSYQATVCEGLGATVHTVSGDVGDETDANRIVDTCIEAFGGIDILVNNAGILTQAKCSDLTVHMWDELMRIDLRSVFLCTRRALPFMVSQRWGRVINIASQLGLKGGAELCHYAAAKAGVIGFTKSVALEVAPDNVLVNAIAPGPIATQMIDVISDTWKKSKAAELPLRRFGLPEEVAPTALLLASDPAGNLFVGQTLGPNSGDVMP